MFLGHLLKRMGMKLSTSGLLLRLPFQTSYYCLSTDGDQILKFLGLDAEKYRVGFESGEDIVRWLIESHIVLQCAREADHNRNHSERKAENKRPFYQKLKEGLENMLKEGAQTPEADLEIARENAVSFFGKTEEVQLMERRFHKEEYYKSKVSSRLVAQLTGLKGPELGRMFQLVKQHIKIDEIEFIAEEELKEMIKSLFNSIFKG
jgi:hypothetical protein